MSLSRSDYRVSRCRRFGGFVLLARDGAGAPWGQIGRFGSAGAARDWLNSALAAFAALAV